MRDHWDLRAATGVAGLCAIVALVVPIEALRIPFALLLCLFLPGYAIVSAVFAKRRLPESQLGLLSIGLSVMVLVLGALLLNYLPGGIRGFWWALLLFAVVVSACRSAALRRQGLPVTHPPRLHLRVSRIEGILLLSALVAVIGAFVIAWIPVSAKNALGYTRLWMLPAKNAMAVRIGVANEDQTSRSYKLEVQASGKPILRELSLDPGQAQVFRIRIPPRRGGLLTPVTATLFRQGLHHVYRQTTAWVKNGAPR